VVSRILDTNALKGRAEEKEEARPQEVNNSPSSSPSRRVAGWRRRAHKVTLAVATVEGGPRSKAGKKKKKSGEGKKHGKKNRGQGQPQQKDSQKTGKEKRLEEKAAASRTTRKISL
jgi:hypothetical protein